MSPIDVFKSARESADGNLSWIFDVSQSPVVDVDLYFAEIDLNTSAYERLCNIEVEGNSALLLYRGTHQAFEHNFTNINVQDGMLNINLEGIDGAAPLISGIQIRDANTDNILYRVNVGGQAITDGQWSEDTANNPSSCLVEEDATILHVSGDYEFRQGAVVCLILITDEGPFQLV